MTKEGFQSCVPSKWRLEMTDLDALVVAACVFVDEYPVPARAGRRPLISDAELVALAVAQAAIGISSDRQFLGLNRPRAAALVPAPTRAVAVQPSAARPG